MFTIKPVRKIPPIPHIELCEKMIFQRRMFNQKKLVNACVRRNLEDWKIKRQIRILSVLKQKARI